ncbi:SIS domain-containing protein [Caulobacter sp. KR2-114]|uniref:SIS domain-containing protein n=1 Tax=Caulobacter sp. KR2-114 TaxID=3400912 RepID=UPI003C0BA515
MSARPASRPPVPPQDASATGMFREAAQAAQVVRDQLRTNEALVADLATRLRRDPPRLVTTLGRGSSDHAATYARYLIETRLGVVTASAPPSVSSVYDQSPDLKGALCIAISQSGKSPDLLAAAEASASAGALLVAMVNVADSPLAELADVVIPLAAGPERSVAATKSYIAALAAAAQLTAAWADDAALQAAIARLPDDLDTAWAQDWSAAMPALLGATNLYTLGRGPGFGVAQEAALKFKETCGLHAEAFSAAEVRHGPMALVGPGFPVIAFVQDDETRDGVEAVIRACADQGAAAMKAGGRPIAGVLDLPTVETHPALQPIVQVQTFYRLAANLAVARGFDPDRPPHLAKVTETR